MPKFRGIYISDDRKKRSFLERRRAANDPWLWALHDDQVARTMLMKDVGTDDENEKDETPGEDVDAVDLKEMAQEALENTELFATLVSHKESK